MAENDDSAEIRVELERRLGYPLHEELWEHLVERRYVSEVQDGYMSVPDLASAVRELRRVFGRHGGGLRRTAQRAAPESLVDDWLRVRVLLQMIEAEADPEVIALRRDLLPGRPLYDDEISPWIATQQALDEDEEVHLPYPDGGIRRPLDYGVDDARQGRVWVRPAGNLDRLRLAGERLARRYGWLPGEATLFLLTRLPPADELIRRAQEPPGGSPRVVLSIDPAAGPEQVAAFYSKVRPPHRRAPTAKQIELARFIATSPQDHTWSERLESWNRDAPAEWTYSADQLRNFHRDCDEARARVLGRR